MKVAIYREGHGSNDRVTFEGAEGERLDAAGEVSFLRAAAQRYASYRGIDDEPEDAHEWDGQRLVVEPIDEDAVACLEWDRDEEGLHRCVDLCVEVSVEVSAVAFPRMKREQPVAEPCPLPGAGCEPGECDDCDRLWAEEAADDCQHAEVERMQERAPLLHGSAPLDRCKACGMWRDARSLGSSAPGGWDRWRPASELAEALREEADL